MTEMQSQFEEWLNGEFDTVQVNGLPVYASFVVQRMWDAWQASRAALVVKLPDWFVSGIDAAVYRDDVIKALSDAGVDYE